MFSIYKRIKAKVFEVIQPAEDGKLASRIFDCFIMFLIAISIISIFLITFDIPESLSAFLERFEKISLIIFTIEYLLRIWTSDLLFPSETRLRAMLKYMSSGMAVIDLLAILPFYLPMLFPIKLLGLRALRLIRLLRIFKLNRYSDSLNSINDVFKSKAREIIVSFFIVLILLVVASLLIYYAEHDAQPEQFKNAFSGLWWAVATLTTVGYGDIYPVTVLGRIVGALIAILGIGMVAIPTGIISSGFMEHIQRNKSQDEKEEYSFCPHCGKRLKK